MTACSDVLTLDSGSSGNKSMRWCDFALSVDNHGSIEHKRMSSEDGTAKGSVGLSESKISMELENRKVCQPSSKLWDCDFYLYWRAFPWTWGASMPWWLLYVRNIGCSGCQECKNMCRFHWKYSVEKGCDCLIWDTTAF